MLLLLLTAVIHRITVYLRRLFHLSYVFNMMSWLLDSLALGLVVKIPSAPQKLE